MKLRLTLPKILILVAVIAFLLGIFAPMGPAILFDPKPKLPLHEKNRIHHHKGFSIIAPEGWMSIIKTETGDTCDSITIFPKKRARFISSITAIKYKNSEEAHHLTKYSEYRKSKFLAFEAIIFEGRSARYHAWDAIFSEDNAWYGIRLMLPHGKHGTRYQKVPDYWWPFINSFRIDSTNIKVE